MKTTKKLPFIFTLIVLCLYSCSSGSKESAMLDMAPASEELVAEADYRAPSMMKKESAYDLAEVDMESFTVQTAPSASRQINFIPTKAADSSNDGVKKFIRKANLRFKVTNIPTAAYAIENIVTEKQGFIIKSEIRGDNMYSWQTRISKDSVLVTTQVQYTSNLQLRVHHSLMDQTLKEIAPLAEVIKYRIVTADDMTIRLLSNKLEQARKKKKGQRVSAVTGANKGHELSDLLDAEAVIDNSNEAEDRAYLANLSVEDQIEYSTIDIVLETDTDISKTTILSKEEVVKEYRESLGKKMGDALKEGWIGLQDVIVALFSIWPFLLIVGIAVFLVIRYRKRTKK